MDCRTLPKSWTGPIIGIWSEILVRDLLARFRIFESDSKLMQNKKNGFIPNQRLNLVRSNTVPIWKMLIESGPIQDRHFVFFIIFEIWTKIWTKIRIKERNFEPNRS